MNAATFECVFENQGQVNCNAANAGQTFCSLGMSVNGTSTFGSVTTCVNNTPGSTGKIVCRVDHSGPATQVKCSNTTYLQSGPTVVGASASAGNCSYNDCELNQVSCASAYAYQQCVPDPASPGCNHWQATNCVANAPCTSTTPAQLAVCMGVPAANISAQAGVYFTTGSSTGGTPSPTPTPMPTPSVGDSSNCYTYNGKTYCVVKAGTSTNTGDKSCAAAGKTCVGYTAYTTDVCKYFHPDASVTTSVNGSKAGFYCNGPPQTGLACANAYNNCQVCPACNVNVTCGEDIGNLFREMYVECSGSGATVNAPSISGGSQLVSFLMTLFKDEKVQAEIQTSDGTQTYCVHVTDTPTYSNPPCTGTTVSLKANENAITAIQNSPTPKAEFLAQKKAGNISYGSTNLVVTIKLFFLEFFAGIFK